MSGRAARKQARRTGFPIGNIARRTASHREHCPPDGFPWNIARRTASPLVEFRNNGRLRHIGHTAFAEKLRKSPHSGRMASHIAEIRSPLEQKALETGAQSSARPFSSASHWLFSTLGWRKWCMSRNAGRTESPGLAKRSHAPEVAAAGPGERSHAPGVTQAANRSHARGGQPRQTQTVHVTKCRAARRCAGSQQS